MLFDFAQADGVIGDALVRHNDNDRWGVNSEFGRLRDVLLAAPTHLEMVPCCDVTIKGLSEGLECSTPVATRQHEALVAALEGLGVRCHLAPAAQDLPDLTFTRDACVMTPWGLLELNPAVAHRRAEVGHIRAAAQALGVPVLGRLSAGTAEGGDVCVLRPGLVVVGFSGQRTNEAGAKALAAVFENRGWQAILYRFDPHFLHLDTQFSMVDERRALACVEALDAGFVQQIEAAGIELIPVSYDEVQRLGANVVSLGGGRILSAADNGRVNRLLGKLGYDVTSVEIDQFTRCGGGIHCLTLPLSRLPV